MKIRVVAVGRIKGPGSDLAIHYLDRAARYFRIDVKEEREGKGPPAVVRRDEGERVQGAALARGSVWALSRGGAAWSSKEWARRLERAAMSPDPMVTLLVGGAWGLSEGTLERADEIVSLSPATLPHDLARVVLYEQLYRAGTLLRGEPYHKGADDIRTADES